MGKTDTICLKIKGFAKPVEFRGCPEFANGFTSILRGWDITECSNNTSIEPLIVFRKTIMGYDWTAPWVGRSQLKRSEPPITVMEAVCDFHYEFIDWYVEEFPKDFCLHCATVKIGDGLVVFPSTQRAGKSIMTMQLAHDNQKVFGDDVLAIKDGSQEGIAFGMLPRVRLPLPEGLNHDVINFVTR